MMMNHKTVSKIFNPVFKYFEILNGTIDKNLGRKTKFLSEESMKTSSISGNS